MLQLKVILSLEGKIICTIFTENKDNKAENFDKFLKDAQEYAKNYMHSIERILCHYV